MFLVPVVSSVEFLQYQQLQLVGRIIRRKLDQLSETSSLINRYTMARKRLYDEIEHISNLFGPVFNTAVHGAVTPSRLSKGKENCIFRWDNSRRNVVN